MKKNSALLSIGVLFGLNVLAWLGVYYFSQPQLLEITFFDIGQGDSIFIETPEDNQILIDGGPSSAVLEKLGKEMPFWDRTIDLIILTHPEHDHIAGLIEVLKTYQVENILWTGVFRDIAEYNEWMRLIKNEGAEIKIAKAGERISSFTPSANPWSFDILYPFENLEGKEFKNTNNTSIVAKLVFGENSFLFTGDSPKSTEKELIIRENSCLNSCQFASLDSDILKVSHHGSKTANGEDFILRVLPEIAVISVGKDNQYGLPSPEVLETFSKYGITLLRTDKNGDIKIVSDGTNLKIK